MTIADAGDTVLTPTIGARARVIVREVLPRGAGGAVILTHRPPGSLTQVRAPAVPVGSPPAAILHADLLFGQHLIGRPFKRPSFDGPVKRPSYDGPGNPIRWPGRDGPPGPSHAS